MRKLWSISNYKRFLLIVVGLLFVGATFSSFGKAINSDVEPLSFFMLAAFSFLTSGSILVYALFSKKDELTDFLLAPFVITFTATFLKNLLSFDIVGVASITSLSFFMEYALVALLFILMLLVLSPKRAYFILSIIFIAVNLVAGLKIYATGTSLVPSDFYLITEGANGILSIFSKNITYFFYVLALIFSLLWVSLRFNFKFQKLRRSEVGILIGALLLLNLGNYIYQGNRIENLRKASELYVSIAPHKLPDGTLTSFIVRSLYEKVLEPKDYLPVKYNRYLTQNSKKQKVNIILISSPLLVDHMFRQTKLMQVTARACNKGMCGYLISSDLAQTLNSEFELLTSLSTSFTPFNSPAKRIAATSYSNVRHLNKEGYHTQAFHSKKYGNLSSRNKMYVDLGFARVSASSYASDIEKNIHSEINSSYDEPLFIYASYNGDIPILEFDGSEKDNRNIEYFMQQQDELAKVIADLIDTLSNKKEKYALIVAGLPNYPVMKSSLLANPNFAPMAYRSPFMVWTNFKRPTKSAPLLGTNFAFGEILNYLDAPENSYHQYLRRFITEPFAFNHSFVWTKNRVTPFFVFTAAELSNLMNTNYDMMQGKQYTLKEPIIEEEEDGEIINEKAPNYCAVDWLN